MSVKQKQNNMDNQRPTIGFLIDSTIQGYEQAIWHGVVEQTKANDVNLVTFNVATQRNEDARRELSQIIDLINGNNLQGLILTTATILDIIPINTIKEFFDRFKPLPMISIGVEVEGIPSLVVDNYYGMRAVVDHLIEDHGYHRIAYLHMFGDNPEANERFRGYAESLANHNIQFDPDLIVPGDYFGLPEEIVALLIDERRVEFDALVAVNDDMATSVMHSLQARGYRIPDDIAIAGFDDQEMSQHLSPPLTSAKQPLHDLGRRAVQYLICILDDEVAPSIINLPTELVVRQSCGCLHPDVTQAFITNNFDENIFGLAGLVSQKDKIVNELLNAIDSANKPIPILNEFFDTFIETINQHNPDLFLNKLAALTDGFDDIGPEHKSWHPIITILRFYTLNTTIEKETHFFAENLFQQARVFLADIAQRAQANLRLKAVRETNKFRIFSQRLSRLSNRQSLFELVARELPVLGIPGCFLIINQQLRPNSEQKQLLLAFGAKKRFPLPTQGLPLKSGDFPPSKYFPTNRQCSYITETIIVQNRDCGFIMLEAGSADGRLYRGLSNQISTALENVTLIEKVEDRAVKLLTALEISRAAISILEPVELIQMAVELIKDRFDLYYAGLFLVDENHQWAVLHAGTGESGANMISENWRLVAGGDSMIGRCIATGEADIQLDVDKAPVHLQNPHLPDTKSEVALPLISRGEILGALTIQSDSADAFSKEDITVLQTMADQVAISLANTQLFKQTRSALIDSETLLNVSRLANIYDDFDLYLQQVLSLTLKSTGIDVGLFSIFNQKTKRLEIAAHQLPEQFLSGLQGKGLEDTLCEIVYQTRETIIVNDLADNTIIDTTGLVNLGFKSYQGVPLEAKGVIFGTLCTFSKSILQPEISNIDLLQAVGQQVANAIENFNLIKQTQLALMELEATQRRYQLQSWNTYNQTRVSSGYRQVGNSLETLGDEKISEAEQAKEKQDPVVTDDGENLKLTIPIMLRDQPIGAIGLQTDKADRKWSSEEISLAQEISEQFALAAESLRLLDETQRRAAREHLVSEITTKLRASNDPQAMIQTAARELREALQAKRTQVIFQQDQASQARGKE